MKAPELKWGAVHGRDTYVSSRLIKERIAELRKQQEELK